MGNNGRQWITMDNNGQQWTTMLLYICTGLNVQKLFITYKWTGMGWKSL